MGQKIELKTTKIYGQVSEQFVGAINDLSKIRVEYQKIYDSDINNKEVVLKQFNYMRIKGINLVDDADDLVNAYLKI